MGRTLFSTMKNHQSLRLTVVIVTWNNHDLIANCLQSLFANIKKEGLNAAVWVVDNASSDGTPNIIRQHFPAATLLEPGENLGFAAGNNLALRTIGFPDAPDLPDLVLLLNPDTIVQPGALSTLIAGLKSTGAGLAGARLVYGDGSFQHSAFAFPGLAQLAIDLFPVPGRLFESTLNGRYPRGLYTGNQPFEVDHPLGASFLLCREVIQQTGMFDEQFWLYCEEIDWAMRIKAAGWKVVCVPDAEIIHLEGQSTGQVRPQSLVNLWAARLKFYRKHYPTWKQNVATGLIRSGMSRKIQMISRDSSQPEAARQTLVEACREVIRLTRKSA